MKRILLFAISTILCLAQVYAVANTETRKPKTDANIIGHVVDKATGEHLPFVSVRIKGTTLGAATDATGHYMIKDIPEGNFKLTVTLLGYASMEKNVSIVKNKTIEVNFELTETAMNLDEVVVSANRNETRRRLAPTLVSVLDTKMFERTNSSSLSQGLRFEPGVRVENNCQNCGFSQVRINGLDGQYSQILIDSRPIFSGLAGIYGLEQIPANMIERVELVRGGGSALYGSSAIGGTINIITKEPERNGGSISHSFSNFGGQHQSAFENVTSFNGSIITDDNKAGIMIFGQNRERDGYFRDADEFTEIPQLTNRGLGFRSFYKTSAYSKISLEYHSMQESRRGGSDLDRPNHEAEITEALEHSVNGGGLKFDNYSKDGKGHFSIFGSAQKVSRKGYYGGGNPLFNEKATDEQKEDFLDSVVESLAAYGRSKDFTYQVGLQHAQNFDNFLFMPAELTVGAEYSGQDLKDVTGLSSINSEIKPIEQDVATGSLFLQNEWKNDKISFLIGARADKHTKTGIIVSPRANFRYNPTENVNFRLTYSEGFRAPQYFDEDFHTELSGGDAIKRVLISDMNKADFDKLVKEKAEKGIKLTNLRPETSRSFSGSVDYYFNTEAVSGNLLVEGFYTTLNGRFTEVHEDGSNDNYKIRYIGNAPENAYVMGTNIEGRFAFGSKVQLQLGATFQKSQYKNEIEVFEHTDEQKVNGQDENGEDLDDGDGIAINHKQFMKTPSMYSYFVFTYNPTKQLSASISGVHTGKMFVKHEQYEGIYENANERLSQIIKGEIRGSKVNSIKRTKDFFELGFKLSYDLKLSKQTTLQLNAGVQNILNSYQPDYDTGGGRASSYAYGPMLPRSYFVGTKLSF